jgi:uncharacterized protein involved in outer membrane biogenesis
MRILGGIFLAILVAVGVLAVVGWYFLHNVDRYIPQVEANLEQRTGLQVNIQHMHVRLQPTLMVTVYGLRIKNPRPFPGGDFVKAPRVDADIEMFPLTQGKIEIRSLVLEHPVIDFISDPDGLWNFQNPSAPKDKPAHFSMGVIHDLRVEDGILLGSNLIDPADTPGPVVLDIHNFSGDLKQIDVQKVKQGDGGQTVAGHIQAKLARFGSIHTRDLDSRIRITPRRLAFRHFDAKTHSGHARGDFSFDFGGKNPTFQTKLQVSGIGMPYLLAEFSQGPPKMTGTMQADFQLAGDVKHTAAPLAGVHGSGHFTIRNGELPSLDGDKSMAQMKRFRDPAAKALPVSAFATFAGDMDLKDRHMYNRRIGVNFYGIDVDGTGSTEMVRGAMDYRGVATIQKKQGFFTDVLASWFKGAKIKDGRMTFRIRLTGTLVKPKFAVH